MTAEEKAVRVQPGGRVTIPRDLRRELKLKEGDFVLLSVRKAEVRAEEEKEV